MMMTRSTKPASSTQAVPIRRPGTGLQQRLQHQLGAAALSVSLVEEAKLFLDCHSIDATAMLRCGPQSGAFSGSFEDGLALRVVHTLTHEDGGDSGGGAFDRDHGPVCFVMFGVQINSLERFT
jgi:hypothetical protein